jgi:hypothetical protein
VVQTEDVMTDHTLYEVEESPSTQHQTGEGPPGWCQPPVSPRGHESNDAHQDRDEGECVKDAVGEGVGFETGNRSDVLVGVAHQVMPLQYLVKDDPINEATKTYTQKYWWQSGYWAADLGDVRGRQCPRLYCRRCSTPMPSAWTRSCVLRKVLFGS